MTDYLDGELPIPDVQEMDTHFSGCADCTSIRQEHRLIQTVLSERLTPPEVPVDRMWQAIAAEMPGLQEAPASPFARLLELIANHGMALAPVPVVILVALVLMKSFSPDVSKEGVAVAAASQAQMAVEEEPVTGSTGRTIHRSGGQRWTAQANLNRWDYVESGFRSYAHQIRSRHGLR